MAGLVVLLQHLLCIELVGCESVVYERTEELREVGAGIALWANATHILKSLSLLEDALHDPNSTLEQAEYYFTR